MRVEKMPIYEYRCGECGHTLDALQKLSDDPLKDCPECAQPSLRRLISAPAFRLKGGGWYETDFKSDKEKRRNLAESGDAKPNDAKPADDKSKSDGKSKGDDKSKSTEAPKAAETAKNDKGKAKEPGGTSTAAA